MRRTVIALAIGGAAALAATVPVAPLASQAAAGKVAGFDLSGFAAPVSVYIYEPEIPIPTEPQGEMDYSYTSATMQSGPFATAVSSTAYPGPTIATGLKQFKPDFPKPFDVLNKIVPSPPNYPIYISASYPGSPSQTHVEKTVGPSGIGMTADANETRATSSAETGTSPAAFLNYANAASTTTATQTPDKVRTTAVATVNDLNFLGNIIQVRGVHSEADASSDASKGTTGGSVTVSGISVLGQSVSVDNKGTHIANKLSLPPIPGVPSSGAALLAKLGISFVPPTVTPTVSGATAKQSIQGLQISVDTTTLHNALNTVPVQVLLDTIIPQQVRDRLCVPDRGQLPFGSCLDDQINAIMGAHPRVLLTLGNTASGANGSKPFVFTPLPFGNGNLGATTTIPGTPGTPGTPGSSGGLSAGTGGGAPGPQVAAPPSTNVAKQFPLGYAGLKGAAVLGALAALLVWYLIRNLGLGVVGGFAGCEHGAPRSVPDLRKG